MWTDGQRTKTNPKTSAEQSGKNVTSKVFDHKVSLYIVAKGKLPHTLAAMFIDPSGPFANSSEIYIKTNLFTKSHDDWAKNVTSRVFTRKLPPAHVIQLTGTIFQLNSRIKERNVLTRFHENWAKNVTSRKNAPPTGGHVFSPIWIIFKLVRHIN
ncbi:hypothetical protein DPMN_138058 [Dreissena polymorpha]|uniref:Uncharacterized protein n=1 Tax=Dreissena polymorpha TaxID=45954 RepID=A0A9D4G3T7_DREPO|nr:hypothetical protein DPMN_138058 [Dreissena polymorpha]